MVKWKASAVEALSTDDGGGGKGRGECVQSLKQQSACGDESWARECSEFLFPGKNFSSAVQLATGTCTVDRTPITRNAAGPRTLCPLLVALMQDGRGRILG